MLNTLKLKLICWLRSHDWKRAVRHTAVSGTQACRRCGAIRPVLLRMPARVVDKQSTVAPYIKELPTSQWPGDARSPLTPPATGF